MFRKYLYEKYKKDNDDYTHLWFSGGKYNITNLEDFYKRYIEAYQNNENLELIEVPIKDGKNILLIDIDIRQDDDNRIYSTEYLIKLCELYTSAIKKYVDCDKSELECLIYERDAPYKDKKSIIKDGLHMIFYKLRLPYEILYEIREYVISKMESIGK